MTEPSERPATTVLDVAAGSRYELHVGDELAGVLVYETLPGAPEVRAFLHTRVQPAFEGRGLGSVFIAAALADARARHIGVLPRCPFVRAYLVRHPEAADVVPADQRPAFGLPTA